MHINAGIAGGVLALIIGKRVGFGKEPMRPHNLTLTMIGAGLLWFGWYGFNVGSIVFTDDSTTRGGLRAVHVRDRLHLHEHHDRHLAAMLGWLLMERILHGKATSLGAASGIVAGLVAITPSCGAVDLVGAIAIGAIAGVACACAVGLKYKFGLDDSLDVVGVHLVGGIIGTVLIGFLSTADAPGGIDGLFYGGGWKSLGDQAGAAGCSRSCGPASSRRSSRWPSSTRSAGGSARTTRSRASTSPSTARRRTTSPATSAASRVALPGTSVLTKSTVSEGANA